MNGNNKVIKIDEYEDIKNIALEVLLKGKPGSDGVCVINDLDDNEQKIKEKLLSVSDDNLNIIKPLFYVVDKCDIFSLKRIERSDEPTGKTFTFSLLDFQKTKSETYIIEIYITVPDDEALPLIWNSGEVEIPDVNKVQNLINEIEIPEPKNSSSVLYHEGWKIYLDELEPGIYYSTSFNSSRIDVYYSKGLGNLAINNVVFNSIQIYHNSNEDVPDGTTMMSCVTFSTSVLQFIKVIKDSTVAKKIKTSTNGFADFALNGKNQNITGLKTFKKLPQSDVVPVDNKDFTNKAYVDSKLSGSGTTVIYDWLDDDETIKNKLSSSLDAEGNLIQPLYLVNDGVMLFILADVDYTENGRLFRFKAGNLINDESKNMIYSVEILYSLTDLGELEREDVAGIFFDNETIMQNVNDVIDEKITGVLDGDY